jgi:tRNA uridine 5-carboxymethylaminomethyl modification enzyme
MLNRAKAVRPGAKGSVRQKYQFRMKGVLECTENLDVKQATVANMLARDGRVIGVETDLGLRINSKSVVITAGTFLRGLLHVGEKSKLGGRMADASSELSESLRNWALL